MKNSQSVTKTKPDIILTHKWNPHRPSLGGCCLPVPCGAQERVPWALRAAPPSPVVLQAPLSEARLPQGPAQRPVALPDRHQPSGQPSVHTAHGHQHAGCGFRQEWGLARTVLSRLPCLRAPLALSLGPQSRPRRCCCRSSRSHWPQNWRVVLAWKRGGLLLPHRRAVQLPPAHSLPTPAGPSSGGLPSRLLQELPTLWTLETMEEEIDIHYLACGHREPCLKH